jgi:SRSO17 transposase
MAARSCGAGQVLAVQPARTDRETHPRALAKLRWRIEHDYREVKTGLGLHHYEGRT